MIWINRALIAVFPTITRSLGPLVTPSRSQLGM
jgi:hypothetical protein